MIKKIFLFTCLIIILGSIGLFLFLNFFKKKSYKIPHPTSNTKIINNFEETSKNKEAPLKISKDEELTTLQKANFIQNNEALIEKFINHFMENKGKQTLSSISKPSIFNRTDYQFKYLDKEPEVFFNKHLLQKTFLKEFANNFNFQDVKIIFSYYNEYKGVKINIIFFEPFFWKKEYYFKLTNKDDPTY